MADLAWIGWVLAFLSLVAGFFYFLANRKVRRITWRLIVDQSLLAVKTGFTDEITVQVGHQTLSRPRSVSLVISNSGNEGLATKEMHKPFELVIEPGSHVRALRLSRVRADSKLDEDLEVPAELTKQRITLPDVLLNPGDRIECSLLIDGRPSAVSLDGEAKDFKFERWPSDVDLRLRKSIELMSRHSLQFLLSVASAAVLLMAVLTLLGSDGDLLESVRRMFGEDP